MLLPCAGKAPLPVQGKDDEVTDREKVLQTDVKRLRAENTTLIKENQRLSYEIYQVQMKPYNAMPSGQTMTHSLEDAAFNVLLQVAGCRTGTAALLESTLGA